MTTTCTYLQQLTQVSDVAHGPLVGYVLRLHGVPQEEREEIYARLHIPNKQEYTEKMVLKSVQSRCHICCLTIKIRPDVTKILLIRT